MKFASLVNSGESLEKALVLSLMTMEINTDFYDQFDEVIIFYDENLPKKDKALKAHGTLEGFVQNMAGISWVPYKSFDDVWDDRHAILENACVDGRISQRMKENIPLDDARCRRILRNLPWQVAMPEASQRLIDQTEARLPKFRFVKLSLRDRFVDFQAGLEDLYPGNKVYLLNAEGFISTHRFGYDKPDEYPTKAARRVESAIASSGNVYLFLMQVAHRCGEHSVSTLGYRPMQKNARPAYDHAILILRNSRVRMINEPKNSHFSDCWGGLEPPMSSEERTNHVVYKGMRHYFG